MANVDENQPQNVPSDLQAPPPNINLFHDEVKQRINSFLEEKGFKDMHLEIESGSAAGDNFMGLIGKLTITCTDENNEKKEFNWMVKTAPNVEMYRQMVSVVSIYERENYLYTKVLPSYREFQKEKSILEPFDDYANFVLSHMEYGKETIVLEDMKSFGYVMRPRQEALDINHVKLIIKAYAKLHALSYAFKDQKPELFKEFSENAKDISAATFSKSEVVEQLKPISMIALSALDPIKDTKIIPIFQKFLENYGEILIKLLQETDERSVICHGDCWVNNYLWKYNSESKIPKKTCIIDWQMCRYANPTLDLCYFIFTATRKDLRDKHYDDMIRLYYYTLCSHVQELGTDPQKYLSLDDLFKDLKKYSLFGLFAAMTLLFTITREAHEVPEMDVRETKNMEDVVKSFGLMSMNFDKYNVRIREVIIDFYEKGYLDCFK